MNKYIERINNLIRVVSSVPDDKFNIGIWWNPRDGCGCAIGHANHDTYFISAGIPTRLGAMPYMDELAVFFGIRSGQAVCLFTPSSCYRSRQDVLSALRVILMQKEAEAMVEFLADDLKEEVATNCYFRVSVI